MEERRGSGLSLTKGRPVGDKLSVAKDLRGRMTPAERYFWEHVRRRRYPGYRFRRNQPLLGFVVDFYCDALQAVIEIDGEIHERTKEYDRERDAILASAGVQILRFRNEDVLYRLPEVMRIIFETQSR